MTELPDTGMTKEDYDRFVVEEGRTPTQDPIYNHTAGNPSARRSVSGEDHADAAQSSLTQAAIYDGDGLASKATQSNEARKETAQDKPN